MMRLIAEISQKYQLEIVKPNLDFILQNKFTPFDNYENAVAGLESNLTQTPLCKVELVKLNSLNKTSVLNTEPDQPRR